MTSVEGEVGSHMTSARGTNLINIFIPFIVKTSRIPALLAGDSASSCGRPCWACGPEEDFPKNLHGLL